MIKMQLLSDVHGRWNKVLLNPDAHLVLALGDMADGAEGVEWLVKMNKPVIYVPGNHEYYGGDLGLRLEELRAKAAGSQVIVADRQTVTAGSVRFLCATLWTDHDNLNADLMAHSFRSLNDYRSILTGAWRQIPDNKEAYEVLLAEFEDSHPEHVGLFSATPDKMTPLIALASHQLALKYLVSELAKPWTGKTIILTHHAPSLHSLLFAGYFTTPHVRNFEQSLARKLKPHKIGGYANSLDYLFSNHRIEMWLHGHLHEGLRYTINGTGVISNPTGYSDNQNDRYDCSMLLLSEDPLRHIKLLCLTLYQSIQHQTDMASLIKKCIMGEEGFAKHHFASVDDVACFTQIYNHSISPLLQQDAKDRNRPDFILELLSIQKILSTQPDAQQTLLASHRQRFLHEMLNTVTANEKRSKDWLVALQSLPALNHWTVHGPL